MSIVRLENLPNEIFVELFRYFSLDELFRQFSSLNRRFDELIRSLSFLTFVSENETKFDHSFSPFVRRFVVGHPFNDEFWSIICKEIRYLHLDYITPEYFQRDFPRLETLIIDRRVHPLYIDEIRRRIFSNFYPRLSRCSISRISPSSIDSPWTGSTSLRVVRLNRIDGQIFHDVLVACPNLFEFQVEIHQTTNFNVDFSFRHEKLRRFRVNFVGDEEKILEKFLFVLPQLDSLRVCRTTSIDSIPRSIDFFSELFRRSLPVLCQFFFNVKLIRSPNSNEMHRDEILSRWKNKFFRNENFRLNFF